MCAHDVHPLMHRQRRGHAHPNHLRPACAQKGLSLGEAATNLRGEVAWIGVVVAGLFRPNGLARKVGNDDL